MTRGLPLPGALGLVAAAAAAGTLATVVWPAARLMAVGEPVRVAVEVLGVGALLAAAAVLSVPDEEGAPSSRTAFVCALAVLALANGAFALWPAVADTRPAVDRGLALYPWMAARHLAGVLLLLAAAQRPLPLGRALAASVGGLVVVEVLLVAAGPALPVPVSISVDGRAVAVTDWPVHVALQVGPTLLFSAGAVLAARAHRRRPAPGMAWLAVALVVLAAAHVHEILYPAMLGPVVTSADALRVLAFALLLLGAARQVRRLFVLRSRVVRVQQADLDHRSALVEQLTAAADAEQLFRQVVGHELATPLAAIRAHAQLLDRALPPPRPDPVERALRSLDGEASRLLGLLQRLEELHGLDLDGAALRCDLRPVRLRPLLEDACRFAEALPGAAAPQLRCHDVRVQADPVRLGQLLRNVLVNARRHAGVDAAVAITTALRGDRVEVEVADDGPGIPAEERAAVLGARSRGRDAVGTPGRGLGLYIARRVAEGHGSALELGEGPGGRGTAVRLQLELV